MEDCEEFWGLVMILVLGLDAEQPMDDDDDDDEEESLFLFSLELWGFSGINLGFGGLKRNGVALIRFFALMEEKRIVAVNLVCICEGLEGKRERERIVLVGKSCHESWSVGDGDIKCCFEKGKKYNKKAVLQFDFFNFEFDVFKKGFQLFYKFLGKLYSILF